MTAAVVLALALVPGPARASGGEWFTRVDEAVAAATAGGKKLFVDFYADWCVWCVRLEEDVYSTEPFRRYAAKFVLLRVDTEDRGEGAALADRFEVVALPTALILSPKLARIGEVRGYAPVEAFIERIEEELEGFRDLETRLARVARSEDPAALRSLAEEFHQRADGARAATLYERLLAAGRLAPDEGRRTRYLLADAWRLDRRFAEATAALERTRAEAAAAGDDLVELLDFLRFRIARDQGRCGDASAALEAFLKDHPESFLADYAKARLESFHTNGTTRC